METIGHILNFSHQFKLFLLYLSSVSIDNHKLSRLLLLVVSEKMFL